MLCRCPRFLEKLPCEVRLLLELVQEANVHVDARAAGAALVYVGGATGLLQQGLDTAHAEEFDAKDHAEIPEHDGKRRPRRGW